ncbi:hypothetical protein GX50_01558 [[Emmonsia] crescens]|uniref:Uncharacterized protein n=1 Tax=[Emmonsia] crescens TaxID=73230 RepID=A0A2B7ZS32_9EURO|nr:hypothetical protein GX50_01558 [Emmonsia crescens]
MLSKTMLLPLGVVLLWLANAFADAAALETDLPNRARGILAPRSDSVLSRRQKINKQRFDDNIIHVGGEGCPSGTKLGTSKATLRDDYDYNVECAFEENVESTTLQLAGSGSVCCYVPSQDKFLWVERRQQTKGELAFSGGTCCPTGTEPSSFIKDINSCSYGNDRYSFPRDFNNDLLKKCCYTPKTMSWFVQLHEFKQSLDIDLKGMKFKVKGGIADTREVVFKSAKLYHTHMDVDFTTTRTNPQNVISGEGTLVFKYGRDGKQGDQVVAFPFSGLVPVTTMKKSGEAHFIVEHYGLTPPHRGAPGQRSFIEKFELKLPKESRKKTTPFFKNQAVVCS